VIYAETLLRKMKVLTNSCGHYCLCWNSLLRLLLEDVVCRAVCHATPSPPSQRDFTFSSTRPAVCQCNPGRRRGSKNRTTVVAPTLLDGEAEELLRKAVERAKAGDGPMLKFLLSRILPRERVGKRDLPPMNFADDAVATLGPIINAVAEGRISPGEGSIVGRAAPMCERSI
jgi:hypothetical protein